jgi:GntR family transcriptional regulator, transcriptional repressor for pyruvate dehydrogenase complex
MSQAHRSRRVPTATSSAAPTRSAAGGAIQRLRQLILESEDGDYLGSEDNLIEWLGISRPTLRQATRVLEHDQLLTIKRGVGGGFYVRKPTIHSVARATAIFLSVQKSTVLETLICTHALMREVIHGACGRQDAPGREALQGAVDALEEKVSGPDVIEIMMDQDRAMFNAILSLNQNTVIALFAEITRLKGVLPIWSKRSDRLLLWRKSRARLGRAILNRDWPEAEKQNERCFGLLQRWMAEDGHDQDIWTYDMLHPDAE